MTKREIVLKRETRLETDGVGFYVDDQLERFVTLMEAFFWSLYEVQEMGYRIRVSRDTSGLNIKSD